MVYKVLVVDDSSFFRMRLQELINQHPELEVVGLAKNGREAIDMAAKLQPDVISMDYEMPYLDGISAVRGILAERRVPIVMFSSMTYEGAKVTLDALAAGAVDFIPKNLAEVSSNARGITEKLHTTLLLFARQSRGAPVRTRAAPAVLAQPRTAPPLERDAPPVRPAVAARRVKASVVVIGASTGGPVALTEVLQALPANFPLPVVVIQHMPENFTKALAERLDRHCKIAVAEAVDGERLLPGRALVAPGGKQLLFDTRGTVKLLPGDDRVSYKPSVDIAFASAAKIYGGCVLGVVLTGMGADGCEGARLLKDKGAVIWVQDEASCVVYGMPKAVASAGLADEVVPLGHLGERLVQVIH